MRGDNPLRNAQSESATFHVAAVRRIAAKEAVEHSRQQVRGNADTGVDAFPKFFEMRVLRDTRIAGDWSFDGGFAVRNAPLRYGPAIHVNQDGYIPNQSKTGKIGYYMGNAGELNLSLPLSFSVVDASTGVPVQGGSGSLNGAGVELRPLNAIANTLP